jgi:hypothetical protein
MHIRLSTVYLLVGVVLIYTSENHARRVESAELECERDYCYNDNGHQCLELNYTRALERNHLLQLFKIVASGTFPIAATQTALAGLGFTSTGIIKGSFAAVWMSKLAIASGGGVAQGSSVAILQALGAAGLGRLLAPLGIGGVLVGTAILYREDLYLLYNDEKFWPEIEKQIKQAGDFIQAIDLNEKWRSGMQYLTNKHNAALESEYFRQVKSRVDQVMDAADQAKNTMNENIPVIKEQIGQAYNVAADALQQVVNSETVNQLQHTAQQLASDWMPKIEFRYV